MPPCRRDLGPGGGVPPWAGPDPEHRHAESNFAGPAFGRGRRWPGRRWPGRRWPGRRCSRWPGRWRWVSWRICWSARYRAVATPPFSRLSDPSAAAAGTGPPGVLADKRPRGGERGGGGAGALAGRARPVPFHVKHGRMWHVELVVLVAMAHAALGRWDRHRRSREPRSSDTAATDTRFPRPPRARWSFVAYAARLATTLQGVSDRLSSHRNLLGTTGAGCNSPSDLRRRERRPGIIERRAQSSGDELDRSALPDVQVRARPAHPAGALSLLRFAPQLCPTEPCRARRSRAALRRAAVVPSPSHAAPCRASPQPCRAVPGTSTPLCRGVSHHTAGPGSSDRTELRSPANQTAPDPRARTSRIPPHS